MGHGGDDAIEPDMTLPDLMMQLLMCLLVCVGSLGGEVGQGGDPLGQSSREIMLPDSSSARPLSPADRDVLAINLIMRTDWRRKQAPMKGGRERLLGAESMVLVPDKEVMSPLEAKAWLKDVFADAEMTTGVGKVKTVVHLRADEDVELNELYKMMNFVKAAGFKKVQLRANIKRG